MKKIGSFLICAALLLSVTACGAAVLPPVNSPDGPDGNDVLNVLDGDAGQSPEDGEEVGTPGSDGDASQNPADGTSGGKDAGQEDPDEDGPNQGDSNQENPNPENSNPQNPDQKDPGQENPDQGGPGEEEPDQEDPDGTAPDAGKTNDPGNGGETTPSGEPKLTVEEAIALIEEMLDQPVSELYAILGEPLSSDYATSCLGPGEDGNLYYDGFTVYTYREGESEVIQGVE